MGLFHILEAGLAISAGDRAPAIGHLVAARQASESSESVGLATMVISDGDEVEVDGTTGRVTVLKQAPNGQG